MDCFKIIEIVILFLTLLAIVIVPIWLNSEKYKENKNYNKAKKRAKQILQNHCSYGITEWNFTISCELNNEDDGELITDILNKSKWVQKNGGNLIWKTIDKLTGKVNSITIPLSKEYIDICKNYGHNGKKYIKI